MSTQPEQMDRSMTAPDMTFSDLQTRIEARRKEVHVIAQNQPVGYKSAFDDFKALAIGKIRETGKEAEYKALQEMTPEQRLQRQADEFNLTKGDLKDYNCTVCNNKGYVEIVKGNELVTRDCKCVVTRRTWRRIHDSGLETQLKEKQFDNFNFSEKWQRTIYEKAQEFLKETLSGGRKWFAICGQTGAGKTHICTAIVGQLIKSGCGAIYMPYRDEIVKLKQAANDASQYQPRMDDFKNIDVLYIDDLFKGKVGEPDINAIYELVGYRYSNHKTTIFSTEVLWERLSEIDGAIAGRINETCGKYLIPIGPDNAKNYRLR